MYLSIKYKYILTYSLLTIMPIIMFHIWIYQIWSEKLQHEILDSQTNIVKQLSSSLALSDTSHTSEYMDRLLADSTVFKASDLMVMDHAGATLYMSDLTFNNSKISSMIMTKANTGGHFFTKFDQEDVLVTYFEHPITKWYLVVSTPTKMIYSQLSQMKLLMIVLILISVFLSIFSIVLISFHLTSPIRTLRKKIESLEDGRFDTLDEQDAIMKDEIWKIGLSFNVIVSKLSEQMSQQYQHQIKINQAKLLALQSQINPHFLHNTLETINSIALIENVPVIAQISRSLSKMFRYNTIQGGSTVTFKEELEHIENYLQVQLIRFDGIITSKIDVDARVMESRTIKFILQPLIENCFNHGLKDLDEQGLILIKGSLEADKIILSIEDNGIGMDSEQLIQMNEKLRYPIVENDDDADSSMNGVGLVNVNTRIKITFGQEYGLSCHALLPRGLSVRIVVPFVFTIGGE